ncbi:amino acid ABC transporter substrate-binding protein [Trinickia violacea]|uniref:Amino acid ABC transporter substrate-binding protein n=1 Tax=Trinickia violacea TaxID=2571746 RepID=A0A4P8IZS9_9BURK|nr:amino acid ABC transporter substrate-binding protein [Trinickia violacea]QCP54131.1 amino acid ABC transporter substrate-binding protein [Trinickia violacea]
MRKMLCGLLFWSLLSSSVFAADVVRPLKSEEYLVRYAYPFELLTEVLKVTTPTYGPYVEIPYTDPISIARSHTEALKGDRINIMISDAGHEDFDEGMIPIPFPIDRGLLGYRVALIDKHNQAKIDTVTTLEQLRSLSVGQGSNWGDVRVYQYNRVPVTTAETYDSLFLMLLHGRFDLFPRGVLEAPEEERAYGPRYPNLAIDRHLLIKYPFAQFFYVSKSQPRLAARIRDGLELMQKNGSFQAFFNRHFASQLSDLDLSHRTIIELQNPYLPAWVPRDRKELWFDPASLR